LDFKINKRAPASAQLPGSTIPDEEPLWWQDPEKSYYIHSYMEW